MQTIDVHLGANSYPIYMQQGLLDRAGQVLRAHVGARRICIVTDQHVRAHYADRLQRSLTKACERGELWCALTSEGAITGVMRVVPRGFCGLYHYLSLIGTSPSVRGKGAGRFLMQEFERMAREDG